MLFVLSCIKAFGQYDTTVNRLIAGVKEASYYDSAKLFAIGQKTISAATAASFPAAIAEVHLYYGNYFFYVNNFKKAGIYFKQALDEAAKANAAHIDMLARIRLAFLEFEKGSEIVGAKELDDLLDEANKSNDYKNIAELLNLIGIIKEKKNDMQGAARLYLQGLSIAETHNLKYYPGVFRNNIGLIKLGAGQVKDALDDFTKGLAMAEQEKNERLASHLKINMCIVYIQTNQLDKAYKLLAQIIKYSKANNLPVELATTYINLASAFNSSGKPQIAINYVDSAIAVLQKHNIKDKLARAYLGKAQLLIAISKNVAAEEYLQQARMLAEEENSIGDLSQYYFMEYEIKEAARKYPEALADYRQYSQLKDSLEKGMNNKIIEELQTNYIMQKNQAALEKEKSKSLMLEKANQQERYTKWLVAVVALILILVLIGLFYIGYTRKLHEQQELFSRQLIKNIDDERKRISIDLHDDIGQSLSIIKSRIVRSNGVLTGKTDDLESELGRVIEQTREISRTLYPSSLEKIGLLRYVASLMENIQSATAMECSFEIDDSVQRLSVPIQAQIARIIQECTNNTIKHSGATGLKLSINEKDNEFTLVYQDNGKGFKTNAGHGGIGLRSLYERGKIINGVVNIEEKPDKGFKLSLKFKGNNIAGI